MAGETIRDYGSWVDLETNGGSTAAAAFTQATASDFSLSTNGGSRPHLEVEFEWTHGTAPTANTPLQFFAQDKTMFGGANHGRAPSANNLQRLVATVLADAVTTVQRRRFDIMFAPAEAAYYLRNGTGQTVSTGWKLRARAWSLKAA